MKRNNENSVAAVVGWVIFIVIFSTFVWGMYQLLLPSWKFSNGEMLGFVAVMDFLCAFCMGLGAQISEDEEASTQFKVFTANIIILIVILLPTSIYGASPFK